MKIKFKWGVKTFSGYGDELVYQSCLKGKLCIGREFMYPKITENNHKRGAETINLYRVFKDSSAEYKADFGLYRERAKALRISRCPSLLKRVGGPFALFKSMMHAWKRSDPQHVDLTAVTIADIVSSDADVRTISRAIGAGFLHTVNPYNDLNHDIQIP